jgi:hypothetical protein
VGIERFMDRVLWLILAKELDNVTLRERPDEGITER